jgi:diguanylate cyclase
MIQTTLLVFLAAVTALTLSGKSRGRSNAEASRWLLFAGAAMGTGLWASQIVALQSAAGTQELEPHISLVVLAWVVCLLLSTLGMALTQAERQRAARLPLATLTLAAASLAGTWLLGRSVAPEVVAAVSLSSTFTASLPVLLSLGAGLVVATGNGSKPRPQRWAAMAAGAAATGVGIAMGQAHLVAQMETGLALHNGLGGTAPLSGLLLLAIIGTPLLLAGALGTCWLESRLQTSLEAAHAALQAEQLQDASTGLPNRVSLDVALSAALHLADSNKGQLALLYIGLDGFRQVNETLGKEAGDRMLLQMSRRLAEMAKPFLVARQGGDEFVILMDNSPSRNHLLDMANSVLELMGRPFKEGAQEVCVTCSLGIAIYPEHGGGASLLSHANVAMRAAKLMGGASYSFFDPRTVAQAREQNELVQGLRAAVNKSELQLYYQPKIHAPSGQITGVEALMRWNHPTRGMVSPDVFVPLAERFGLINTLGNWLIDEACRQARAWRDEGLRMRVAINLSVNQLSQPDLCARIEAALARHNINPSLLTCEITESVAMEESPYTAKALVDLGAMGVHISIDDFGSGYSSLGSLRKLPASELKIDRSFVLDIDTSEEARKVIEHVVNLAKTLNLHVVAEGVETDNQYQLLRRMGVDQVQGYLFAKPMSAKALALWAMNDMGPKEIQFRDSLFLSTDMHSEL